MPRLIRKRQINMQTQSLAARLRGLVPRFIQSKISDRAEKPRRHNHLEEIAWPH